MKKILFVFLSILFLNESFAQDTIVYPQDYFRSPVDIPIYLSGTFGEPRSTHFHAGLDIKTQGVEGKNVYATADGYISRIKVSPWGYGNALYITHPNGYTTVYGHLKSFDAEIAKWVEEQQYSQTSFSINEDSLSADLFPVTKGDIIALSGNSGSSGGPHLHFEIRDSLERPHNPLLFGFSEKIKDNVKPTLMNVVVYNQTTDRYATDSKTIKVTGSYGNYSLTNTVKVNRDEIGFGIHTYDKLTGVSNKNGVYAIDLYVDDAIQYQYEISKFAFHEGKYVYTHCDYWLKRNKSQSVHRCFREKGNQLPTYPYLDNDGVIFLYDNDVHNVKIVVKDYHGNESVLNFKVQKTETSTLFTAKEDEYVDIFVQGKRNHFHKENIHLDIPENALFDDVFFEFEENEKNEFTHSYEVHNHETPVFTYFDLKLRHFEVDSNHLDKYLIVYKNYKNRFQAMGGEIDSQYIKTKTRAFGHYYISIDTVAPTIKPQNISEGKSMTYESTIELKISDNLSGVAEYNAFLNGEWILLKLDGKKGRYYYEFDERVLKGENTFELIAADERNNSSHYTVTFKY